MAKGRGRRKEEGQEAERRHVKEIGRRKEEGMRKKGGMMKEIGRSKEEEQEEERGHDEGDRKKEGGGTGGRKET